MYKRITTAALAIVALAEFASAASYTLKSPDGRLSAEVTTDGQLKFSVSLSDACLLPPSPIGVTAQKVQGGKTDVGNAPAVASRKTASHRGTIDAPFYRQKSFADNYNELDLKFKNGFGLRVRAYDEGAAYRFYNTNKGAVKIISETADYRVGGDKKAWLSYTTNPEKPYAMAFQNYYHETRLDTAKGMPAFLPATVDCGKAKLTILESDLVSYPGMWLRASADGLKAEFAPYPTKTDYYPWRHMTHVTETADFIAKGDGATEYPWRVFAVTENDAQMPTNNLVYALARKNAIGDTSWIRPGKVAWDWWSDWNLKGVPFKAGINYDTYKYYINFAAKYGLEYVVLDEGWYNSAEGSILKPIDEIRLPELVKYAAAKNVGVVLWSVFNVMDENLEEICKTYSAMGVKGFKVDFMDRDDQTAVEMIERLAKCAAKHKLILDLHGLYKPVGLNRTYPNILNYESVFGMEEARWTKLESDMPRYDVTFPFIRMMAGQVDFTPGAMRNGTRQDWAAIYNKPISMGTRCHQAACYIVQDSPFTMLADTPTNYEADQPYTRFLASLPVVFDETKVLQGEIGEYIVTARRAGDDWYIGGQTNWTERDLTLDLSFLADNAAYDMTLLRDGINADHNAEDYLIDTMEARKSGDRRITVHLAPGGGFAVKLIKRLNQTNDPYR